MSHHDDPGDPSNATAGQTADRPAELLARIRGALLRKALADARQRGALARRLQLTDTEVLAIQHLALTGELTPGQLASQLQLSSGGATGLIQRLQRDGHVTRHANPHDRRSAVVRLSARISALAAEAWQPYTTALDAIANGLSDDEREAVRRYLEDAAEAAERHADRVVRDANTAAHDELTVPLPALWA
jgi:DNA-binding MarR family transcriptional regulator